ncbi:MAG TPA: hypothetical protein VGR20_11790, partial [Acidimicrobiia bacterium]|nr:hypothetical protein [Acidimicrobiia bacterium]
MIEPEAVPPAPRTHHRRRAVVAGMTLLAVVTGGVAMAASGRRPEAKPLALMAGNGTGTEKMAAPAAAGAALADSRSSAPYPSGGFGGWGLQFTVDGALGDLPGVAAAWTVSGPALDQAALARIVGALGLTGSPVQRDGGWFLDGGDWSLNAFPGGDTWSVNFYRTRYDGRPDDATGSSADA